MAKIMLVEDDKSLREIYSIRLVAEGYEIVSASDGEEALGLAVQEKPDLIISDVMMPKISGFDMLDIIRSTPETQNIKVIMMTALSSDDQRQRSEALGAEKHLVKSQCGIEDVINAVHEVLGDRSGATPAADAAAAPVEAAPVAAPTAEPATTTEAAPAPAEPVANVAPTEPEDVTPPEIAELIAAAEDPIEPQQSIAPVADAGQEVPPAPVVSATMEPAPAASDSTSENNPVQPTPNF